MQEEALVALDCDQEIFVSKGEGGYGRETDWWSLGATIYELVFGVAPFFAKDIRGTYDLIINHEVRKDISRITWSDISFREGYVSLSAQTSALIASL
jgi:serine/threonine protein kinase